MKKFNLFLISIISMFFVLTAYAAAPKIGIVNFQKVMQELPKTKQDASRMEKQFTPEKEKIEQKKKKIDDLEKKLKRDSSVMQAKDKTKIETQLKAEQTEFLTMAQSFQGKVLKAQQDTLKGIIKSINDSVAKVAKQNKLDLVLQSGAVVYSGNAVDITSQVIKAGK